MVSKLNVRQAGKEERKKRRHCCRPVFQCSGLGDQLHRSVGDQDDGVPFFPHVPPFALRHLSTTLTPSSLSQLSEHSSASSSLSTADSTSCELASVAESRSETRFALLKGAVLSAPFSFSRSQTRLPLENQVLYPRLLCWLRQQKGEKIWLAAARRHKGREGRNGSEEGDR